MAPLVIVPPDCATRAKAAFVQVWSPAGRNTRWILLLKIPVTVMVVREWSMMLGVRITVGGAGGGEGGGGGGAQQVETGNVPETFVRVVAQEQTVP